LGLIAQKRGKLIELYKKTIPESSPLSRNQKAFDYPQLLYTLKLLPAERAILDGEAP